MTETERLTQFLIAFTAIVWEAFPFIVLGALIAGILEEVVPQQAITKIIPRSKLLAVVLGGTLGLIFPMCECGIVPIMRRLLRKGLPLGTCVAYMMAGPIVNLIVIGSTVIAFSGHGIAAEMTILRVGLGFLVAVVTGVLVEIQYRKYGNELLTPVARPTKDDPKISLNLIATPDVHPAEERAGQKQPVMNRLSNIAETALHDFKDIMVFLMFGAFLAALAKTILFSSSNQAQPMFPGVPAALTILAMMLLAIVMCLCSEADAFVAASFTTLNPASKLGFLVLGPMFDLKLLLMFTRVFRKRLILLIFFSAFIQVFAYCLIVHYSWDLLGLPGQYGSTPDPVIETAAPK